MGRILLITTLLALTACNGGTESGSTETKVDGSTPILDSEREPQDDIPIDDATGDETPDLVDDETPIDETEDDTTSDDTGESETMPQYTVLENYGFINNVMPLEFQNDQFNTTRIRTYWIYTDGRAVQDKVPWDGNYILKCYDEVTINGDETSGVIQVRNSRYLWRFNSTYECNSDGDYPYSVDENGMHIEVNGQVLTFNK